MPSVMTRDKWAQYDACGQCNALAGEPCRNVRSIGRWITGRTRAPQLGRPHRGRDRNPGRVSARSAGGGLGGTTRRRGTSTREVTD